MLIRPKKVKFSKNRRFLLISVGSTVALGQINGISSILTSSGFLNLSLSEALNQSQKFRHFLCFYMIYIEKKVVCRKCMDVCVHLYMFSLFSIDFGNDLPKIVGFRKYCGFCIISRKYVFI